MALILQRNRTTVKHKFYLDGGENKTRQKHEDVDIFSSVNLKSGHGLYGFTWYKEIYSLPLTSFLFNLSLFVRWCKTQIRGHDTVKEYNFSFTSRLIKNNYTYMYWYIHKFVFLSSRNNIAKSSCRKHMAELKEKASQLNNCYNSIHCNFLFVNN
jgi:hypothetical protein